MNINVIYCMYVFCYFDFSFSVAREEKKKRALQQDRTNRQNGTNEQFFIKGKRNEWLSICMWSWSEWWERKVLITNIRFLSLPPHYWKTNFAFLMYICMAAAINWPTAEYGHKCKYENNLQRRCMRIKGATTWPTVCININMKSAMTRPTALYTKYINMGITRPTAVYE